MISHEYDGIKLDIVYEIATMHIGALKIQLNKYYCRVYKVELYKAFSTSI